MDSALVFVTIISLSMALLLSGLVWRLLREEQRRSAARVAALAEETTDQASTGALPLSEPGGAPAERPVAAPGGLLSGAPSSGTDTAPPHLLFAVVSGFVFIAVAAAIIVATGSDRSPSTGAAGAPPPLELLSLRHTIDDDRLSVAGLVRNPTTAGEARRLVALALAFDHDGTFVASGRGPIELPLLGPGEESPFTVIVPAATAAGRYRVSFRDGDGRLVPHIDRRRAGRQAGEAVHVR